MSRSLTSLFVLSLVAGCGTEPSSSSEAPVIIGGGSDAGGDATAGDASTGGPDSGGGGSDTGVGVDAPPSLDAVVSTDLGGDGGGGRDTTDPGEDASGGEDATTEPDTLAPPDAIGSDVSEPSDTSSGDTSSGDTSSGDTSSGDTSSDDTSGVCTTRCEGDRLFRCDAAGREQVIDCAEINGICEGTALPACVPRLCTPGEASCDGDDVVVCNDRGSGRTVTECDGTCRDGACIDDEPVTCEGEIDTLTVPFDRSFDLCDEDDERDQVQGGTCTVTRSDGNDRTFQFVVERSTRLRLDLRDNDGTVAIDTVLYVRTSCDDASSQVACSDDISCNGAAVRDGCPTFGSGTQPRQSVIERTFEPGTYYVVADQLDRDDRNVRFRCGVVRLVVTQL